MPSEIFIISALVAAISTITWFLTGYAGWSVFALAAAASCIWNRSKRRNSR